MKGLFHTRVIRVCAAGVSAGVLLVSQAGAQIEAQWRGVHRDGIYEGGNLLGKWPEKGPALLLTIKDLGTGYSSAAVTKDRIYITGMIERNGYLFAYDLKGALIWKSMYGPEWSRDYPGVRGTPTVEGNRIYLESGMGRVVCLNTADGKEIWGVDMVKVFGGVVPKWGYNESIVIDGDRAICTPGGAMATICALDKATGKTLWSTPVEGSKAGYCSPVKITHAKREILVSMTSNAVIGVDPASGKLLWKQEQSTMFGINPNTPIYSAGNLLCFSGYGKGALMLKLSADGLSVTKVWENGKFDIQIGGAVLLGNNLYGSGHKNAAWQCVDIQTGKLKYSSSDLGRGSIVSAGGLLYCYSEKGVLSLVKPEADKFTVLSSIEVGGAGPHWPHPVIADGRLYIRHDTMLMVYNIAG